VAGSRTGSRGGSAAGRSHRATWWRRLSGPAKAAYAIGTVLTIAIVTVVLGAYHYYIGLEGNLHGVHVGGLTHRSVYGEQNILILGSQTRDGQGKGFGYDPGTNLSDNLILVHLDATHTHATVLSIPRDTMVYEPPCKARPGVGTGTWPAYQAAIIDGAMNLGGPTCAVRTVEDLTGIKIDHFIEFNFNSFRAMVDALGGVEVCVPPGGYRDPWSHLHLSAGRHRVTYNQALAYVRTRHGVGNGGDLGRIELQQAFMSSAIQKVTRQGLLSNLGALLKVADLATKALTVDQGLDSVDKLLHLASTLRYLRTSNVTFLTMPNLPWPPDPDRLETEQPQADVIFHMILAGQLWHHDLPLVPPGQVQVRVLNGSGVTGLARRTATELRKLGFDVVMTGNSVPVAATTVEYSGTAQADAAYTLMTRLLAPPSVQDEVAEPAPQTGRPGAVTLIIGPGFTGIVHPAPQSSRHRIKGRARDRDRDRARGQDAGTDFGPGGPSGIADVETRNAAANICSGLPKANPDAGTPP
jgi:LCP family protein required for cell wall assembly